jgi:hypothetical protein
LTPLIFDETRSKIGYSESSFTKHQGISVIHLKINLWYSQWWIQLMTRVGTSMLEKNILPRNISSQTQYFAQLSPFSLCCLSVLAFWTSLLLLLSPLHLLLFYLFIIFFMIFVLSSSLPTRLTFDIFESL